MKQTASQPPKRRSPPDGFWYTAKGRQIIADREAAREREAWARFDGWR